MRTPYTETKRNRRVQKNFKLETFSKFSLERLLNISRGFFFYYHWVERLFFCLNIKFIITNMKWVSCCGTRGILGPNWYFTCPYTWYMGRADDSINSYYYLWVRWWVWRTFNNVLSRSYEERLMITNWVQSNPLIPIAFSRPTSNYRYFHCNELCVIKKKVNFVWHWYWLGNLGEIYLTLTLLLCSDLPPINVFCFVSTNYVFSIHQSIFYLCISQTVSCF